MTSRILSWVPKRLLMKFGVPADLYSGAYLYRRGRRVFPRWNAHLLSVAEDVETHDTFFNLEDTVTVESGVVLGHEVMFLTGRHEVGAEGVDVAPDSTGPILVRERAWIASRAIVLGGVTIGTGSIIGAGSVVTKSVPDHQFWAGNPAKFVREVETRDGG